MKKKVRIYKSPNGVGKYITKLSKFTAQAGGEQDQQAQMYDYVYKTLSDAEPFEFDIEKEALINELAAAQIPIEQAEQMVEDIASQLEMQTMQAEQMAGTGEAKTPAEEEEEDLAANYDYYGDTGADGEDDDDDEDYDDSESYMQDGGPLIPQANTVSISGFTPTDYIANNQFALGGVSKRKFVGSVMKMLKKQAGGEGEEVEDKADSFNPQDTADNKVSNMNKGFVSALASNAQEAKMKEKAEAMWEEQQQMMQQPQPEYYPTEEVPMAQRGMSVRQMRRMMPRGFGRGAMNSFAGWLPQGGMFPMGMNIMTYPQMQVLEQKPINVQGTMPGMKLDVRKSHWLTGRPSQYSIEFGGDFAIPGFGSLPGGGTASRSMTRRKIEGTSRIVNKAADPSKNAESTNLKTTDKSYDKDNNGVPDNIQSNPVVLSTRESQYDKNKNSQLDVTEVATNLPSIKPEAKVTNPNKDAVGKGAKVPTKTATNKSTPTSNKIVLSNSTPKKEPVLNSSDLVNKHTGWKKPASAYSVPESNIIPEWMRSSINSESSPAPANNSIVDRYLNEQLGKLDMLKNIGQSVRSVWDMRRILPGGFESGGFVDSSNPDLYKFIYGGNDPITQQDMEYSDSKNSASPYFAKGGMTKYQDKGEVKEDDYDKYLREKAESEAVAEYNAYMNRGEADKAKHQKYTANTNDSIYTKILGLNQSKYGVKTNQNKSSDFAPITDKAEYDKRLAEERKKWQTEYDDSNYSDQGTTGGYNYNRGYGSSNYADRYIPGGAFGIRRLGTWSQQQGMPFDPRTGQVIQGGFGPNANLTKIDVRKSGWLSGKPKKYTMYFNNYEVDPALQKQFASLNANQSASGTANTKQTPKDFFNYSDEDWNNMSAREKRQEKRNMKSQEWVDSLPDSENQVETEEAAFGPSTEEVQARDAATEANKGVIRNFSEVEGVQDDPFGIGMGGGNEEPSDFEESTTTYDSPEAANEYVQGEWGDIMTDVSEVLGPESQQEFDQFLTTNPSKGAIDAKIEEFMTKRNQVIGKDAEAVERDNLTADAEEEIMNQQAMRRNPMFMGSSGAPAVNPNFGATPEIATGNNRQLSQREQAEMDYILQNRRSSPADFQPYASRRKPSEDLYNLAYNDNRNVSTLPATPLETANYEDMLLSGFPQYTDAFEGAASNDEQYLPGTMNDMSEGSMRNREIAAKKAYEANIIAEANKQKLAKQQKMQLAQGNFSGSNISSNSTGSNSSVYSGGGKNIDSPKSAIQNLQNKGSFDVLYDPQTGDETPVANNIDWSIMKQWEGMKPADQKKAGGFNKWVNSIPEYRAFYAQKNRAENKRNVAGKRKKQFGGPSDPFNNTYENLQRFIPQYNPGGPVKGETSPLDLQDWASATGKDPQQSFQEYLEYAASFKSKSAPTSISNTTTTTTTPISGANAPQQPSWVDFERAAGRTVTPQPGGKMAGYAGYEEDVVPVSISDTECECTYSDGTKEKVKKKADGTCEPCSKKNLSSAAPMGTTLFTDTEGNEVIMSPEEAQRRLKEGEIAVDFKNKNTYEVDAQAQLLQGNAIANTIFDKLKNRQTKKAEAEYMYNNQFANTKYGSDPSRQFGNYETNSGLFRPNEQGQIFNSQKGGSIDYTEGDEVMMTEEELKEFLANGGQVEYL